MTDTEKLTKEEFCARFKARMISRAGEKFDDGSSIAEYADETAPAYWRISIGTGKARKIAPIATWIIGARISHD